MMKAVMVIGILLVLTGIIGFILGGSMFGDIGVAAMIGAVAALLSGLGLIAVSRALKKTMRK